MPAGPNIILTVSNGRLFCELGEEYEESKVNVCSNKPGPAQVGAISKAQK